MQVLEKVKERTRTKVAYFLSHHQSHLAEQFDLEVEGGSSRRHFGDLACIGVGLDTQWYRASLSIYTGDWVDCYMMLERADEAVDHETPPPVTVDAWEPYREHAVVVKAQARKAVQPFVEGVKLLLFLGQGHFKNQFIVEETFCDEQRWSETLEEVLVDARDTAHAMWREVLRCYASGSSMISRQSGGTTRDSGCPGDARDSPVVVASAGQGVGGSVQQQGSREIVPAVSRNINGRKGVCLCVRAYVCQDTLTCTGYLGAHFRG
jgi:hypothetical protein